MIAVKKEGVVLLPTALAFENVGVLNPGVFQDGAVVHLFYRAVREGNYSTIGYCRLDGPLTVAERLNTPVIVPFFDYEERGVEDPRVVKIDGIYYLTYNAYDGVNALGALMTSTDLVHFERRGLLVPQLSFDDFRCLAVCNNLVNKKYFRHTRHFDRSEKVYLWNKDVIFFPRRINGKLCFLHRIKPGIQIVAVNDLAALTKDFWDHYFLHFNEHIVLDPMGDGFEAGFVGGGCPPIATEHGWILIYHGVHDTASGYVYSACAALLALDSPSKVIARLPYPLFVPELPYELDGVVYNVVFPTGTALFDDTLYIYYGAADTCIAVASLSFTELINQLLINKQEQNEK